MFRKRASAVVLLLLLVASVSAQVNEVGDYVQLYLCKSRSFGENCLAILYDR